MAAGWFAQRASSLWSVPIPLQLIPDGTTRGQVICKRDHRIQFMKHRLTVLMMDQVQCFAGGLGPRTNRTLFLLTGLSDFSCNGQKYTKPTVFT